MVISRGAPLDMVTVATIGVVDSSPLASLATTLKALATEPFCAVVAGVQYALWVLSITLLVAAFQAVAVSALLPILSKPLATDLTINALTLPSTSTSLPCASNSSKVISTGVLTVVLSTGLAKAVKVGASLVPVIVMLAFWLLNAP